VSTHRIHIFISHSWSYSNHYNTLVEWVFRTRWRFGEASVVFYNYSVSRDDPIHGVTSDRALRDAIYRKISRCHGVVIPIGMYVNYSKWIRKEIGAANNYSKPILGVNPWGQKRTSTVVRNVADTTVGWNRKSVVRGIWDLYRG